MVFWTNSSPLFFILDNLRPSSSWYQSGILAGLNLEVVGKAAVEAA